MSQTQNPTPLSDPPTESSRPTLSVVVPCYNEQEVIEELHRRLTAVCRQLGASYEIVFVNDGSRDRTWSMIQDFAASDAAVVGVDLSRNHGHQLALSAGLSICQGDRVLIIDADLQDPPELLPEMMELMDRGADVVYGRRVSREGESSFKLWTAAVFYRLLGLLTDVPIPPDTGDFRLMSRRALDVLLAMPERHRFIRGMVSWIGFEQVALDYERKARLAGETKYPFRKMFRLAIDAITAFSTKPLRIATGMGVLAGAVSICVALYAIVSWWFNDTVSGWTSIVALITFIGSVQLIVLGIIGEYLGRLYEQTKGRPMFVVREISRRLER